MSLDQREQRTGSLPTKPEGTPEVPNDISSLVKLDGGAPDVVVGAPVSGAERKKKWHQYTGVRIAGAVLAVSAIAIPTGNAVVSALHSEVGAPNPGQPFPEEGSPDYDAFQKIGNNSEITIGDVDRLLTYFNSGEMDRKALIAALAQANQEEVDHIFEVMGNTDDADNSDVTDILAQYGLNTSEVPRDLMGRISEENDLVEQDVDAIAALYQDVPYDDLRAALADFTPDEAATALEVISGSASLNDLNEILRIHGIDAGGDFVS